MSTPGKEMRCAKCGNSVVCNSPIQKYCRACSPWKRQLKKEVSQTLVCAECGKSVPRKSVRQYMCSDCSRWQKAKDPRLKTTKKNKGVFVTEFARKNELGWMFTCPKCKKEHQHIGNRNWRPQYWAKEILSYDYSGRQKHLYCPTCKKIKDRQDKAKEIKSKQRRKKLYSHYSKFLIALVESGKEEQHDVWSPMRYVSREEIDSCGYKNGVPVFSTHSCHVYGYVYDPGFYRLPSPKGGRYNELKSYYPCSSPASPEWNRYEWSKFLHKHEQGAEPYERRVEEQKQREWELRWRKKNYENAMTSKDDINFFRTLGMMDMVKTKLAL